MRSLHNHTLFVPSYSDHIVLPSKYVTFSPNENGKFKPDFWTNDDTAAEPKFLSRSIVEDGVDDTDATKESWYVED